MSKTTIHASTLQRFMTLSEPLKPITLKIEINNGKCYLIGSNDYIACVEYLGETDQPNDSCYIKPVAEAVNKETDVNGSFTFETLPELAMGSTYTTSGNRYNDFIIWPDKCVLDNWRDWFTISDIAEGFMYCNLFQIESLWHCSPSGEIVFPEVINANEPVIVRDVNDNNWLGVFIPAIDEKKLIKPATLPEWL